MIRTVLTAIPQRPRLRSRPVLRRSRPLRHSGADAEWLDAPRRTMPKHALQFFSASISTEKRARAASGVDLFPRASSAGHEGQNRSWSADTMLMSSTPWPNVLYAFDLSRGGPTR